MQLFNGCKVGCKYGSVLSFVVAGCFCGSKFQWCQRRKFGWFGLTYWERAFLLWSSKSLVATLSEAFSAMCGGILQDDVGLTAEQVSFLMALVALGTMTIWVVYLVLV